MAQPPEPKHLKEALIELMAEKYELHDSGFIAPTLSNPAYGFEFDPSALEHDESFRAFAAFDTIDIPCSASTTERDNRLQGLNHTIKSHLLDVELHEQVMRLVDDEFRDSDCPVHLWTGKPLAQKAYQLSIWRTEKALSHPPKPVDYHENLKNYEFKVRLLFLHYGYSEIVNQKDLYFSYDTPFHGFLGTLRHQTVLCTIPPRALPPNLTTDLAPLSSRESSRTLSVDDPVAAADHIPSDSINLAKTNAVEDGFANIPQKEILKLETSSEKAKKYQGGSKKPNPSMKNPIPEVIRRPRHPSDKGYTLNDGPWRYKISNPGPSCFTDITNEEGYRAMLASLRKPRDPQSSPPKRSVVVFMHSMDRDAWARWSDRKKEEEEEIKSLRERLAQDPHAHPRENDDAEWGELYSTWWLRNAQQGTNDNSTTTAESDTQGESSHVSLSINSDLSPPKDESTTPTGMNSPPSGGKGVAIPERVRSSSDVPLFLPAQPSEQ